MKLSKLGRMTHQELLAKINEPEHWFKPFLDIRQALRAVVELHKPIDEDGKLFCSQELCYNHIEFLERDKCDCSYPCPTIKAIQKELE